MRNRDSDDVDKTRPERRYSRRSESKREQITKIEDFGTNDVAEDSDIAFDDLSGEEIHWKRHAKQERKLPFL